METCDDEFVDGRRRLHPAAAQPAQAVLLLGQHHAHARPHAHEAQERGPGRPLAVDLPRHDGRPRQERRPAPRPARRARDRRRHDRDVLDRQWAAHEHVARRGDDAVPQREEHELGGRLPDPADGALAGEDPGGRRLQRDRAAPRLATDVPRGRGRAGRRREAEGGPRRRRQDVQGAHRRLQPAAVPHRRGGARARARDSSTSRTTATSSRCASTTGRSSSWSSGRRGRSSCGPSRSRRSGCRSSSTCAPTRSSGRT